MTTFTPAVIAANKAECEAATPGPYHITWLKTAHAEGLESETGKKVCWLPQPQFDFEGQQTLQFFVAAADPDTGFLATTLELERVQAEIQRLTEEKDTAQNEAWANWNSFKRLTAELAKRDEPGRPSENWIIKYEDPDKPDLTFTGAGAELAARLAFGRTGDNWACRLFAEVASTGCGEN